MRSQIERLYPKLEKIVVVCAFLYFLGAIIPVLRNPSDSAMAGQVSSRLNLLLQLAVYAALLPFVIRVKSGIVTAALKNPVITGLFFLALLSCAWSDVPLYSLRRALVFGATTVVGFYLGTRFEWKELLRLVSTALIFCAVLSVVYIVALPHYGVEYAANAGAWRGVFLQKNIFARYMVLALISLLCLPVQRAWRKTGKYLCLSFILVMIYGSQSKGSFVVALVAMILMLLYHLFTMDWKKLMAFASLSAIAAVAAVTYLLLNLDTFFQFLGKDATLTARVPIWNALFYLSQNRRWLGFGFDGFWTKNLVNVRYILGGFAPGKAHNGFIDLMLELGLVGVGIFAVAILIAMRRSVRLIVRERTWASEWPLMMLSLVVLDNLFESDLMVQNGYLWVLFVAVSVAAQRAWSYSRVNAPVLVPSDARLSAAGYEPCPQ